MIGTIKKNLVAIGLFILMMTLLFSAYIEWPNHIGRCTNTGQDDFPTDSVNEALASISEIAPIEAAQAASTELVKIDPVPEINSPEEFYYVRVEEGDTLGSIAKNRGNGYSYLDIYELNKDSISDVNKIQTGQLIRIFNASKQIPPFTRRFSTRKLSGFV